MGVKRAAAVAARAGGWWGVLRGALGEGRRRARTSSRDRRPCFSADGRASVVAESPR